MPLASRAAAQGTRCEAREHCWGTTQRSRPHGFTKQQSPRSRNCRSAAMGWSLRTAIPKMHPSNRAPLGGHAARAPSSTKIKAPAGASQMHQQSRSGFHAKPPPSYHIPWKPSDRRDRSSTQAADGCLCSGGARPHAGVQRPASTQAPAKGGQSRPSPHRAGEGDRAACNEGFSRRQPA